MKYKGGDLRSTRRRQETAAITQAKQDGGPFFQSRVEDCVSQSQMGFGNEGMQGERKRQPGTLNFAPKPWKLRPQETPGTIWKFSLLHRDGEGSPGSEQVGPGDGFGAC